MIPSNCRFSQIIIIIYFLLLLVLGLDAHPGLDNMRCFVLLLLITIGCVYLNACNADTSCDFTIGSFNIQVLGQSKISKGYVVDQLVTIIRRYDALLIQEIRDSQGSAITRLFAAVNSTTKPYDYVLSPRLGRTSSKEQYALFYRSDRLSVPRWYVYNDSVADVFEREPLVAQITGAGAYQACLEQPITIIGVHVRPSDVASELNALVGVYNNSVAVLNNDNALITGDFNADCSYLSNKAAASLSFFTDTRFSVLINKSADTTVSASSCAYDRIAVAGAYLKSIVLPNSATVYRYDSDLGLNMSVALDISDHYPVEVQLQATEPPATTATVPSATVQQEASSASTGQRGLGTGSGSTTRAGTLAATSSAYMPAASLSVLLTLFSVAGCLRMMEI